MSTAVYPVPPNYAYPVGRTQLWSTNQKQSVSGKRLNISYWSYPMWEWTLTYEYLLYGPTDTDFKNLFGFFGLLKGAYDSFLFQDPDDNTVAGQAIGTGDGATTIFQLQRTFGTGSNIFTEPIFAPNSVSHVYVNSVDGGGWSISSWGSANPGKITFNTPPSNGLAITADFTYYFPCYFKDDKMDPEKFVATILDLKKITFNSIK